MSRGWDSPGLCSLYLSTPKSSKERMEPGFHFRASLGGEERQGPGLLGTAEKKRGGPEALCKARERYVGEVARTQRRAPGIANRRVGTTHTKSQSGP